MPALRLLRSRQFLPVAAVVIAVNVLYGLLVAWNPLLLYLSLLFLVLDGVSVLLAIPGERVNGEKKPTRRYALVAVGGIMLCALALRAIGAGWGFPILGDADEGVVTDPAVTMIDRADLDPVKFHRPNHISIYASEILYPIVGRILSPDETVRHSYERDTTPFFLTSRLVTAGWGVLMTVAAYLVGSVVAPPVGLIAAALCALFPPFVESSHHITPDVPLTTLLLFVVLFCLRYLRDGRMRDLYLALVFSCLAIAEKYPAVLTLPLLLAVVVLRAADDPPAPSRSAGRARLRDRKAAVLLFLAAAALAAIGAYAYGHPHISSRLSRYISSALHHSVPADFASQVHRLSALLILGAVVLAALAAFLRFLRGARYGAAMFVVLGMPIILFLVTPYLVLDFPRVLSAIAVESEDTHLGADNLGYLGNLLYYAGRYLEAAGIVSLLFMAAGAAFVFRRRSLLPVLFGFLYWICLSALSLHFARWALPMYTGPLLLVSVGLYRSFLFVRTRIGGSGALAVLGVVCAAPLVSMLLSSVTTTYRLVLPDTRAVAFSWCRGHGLTEQNTLYDGYTPFKPGGPRTADYPGSGDAKYVMVSSEMYDRYLKEPERYKGPAAMYERVFALPLLASFTPVEPRVSSSYEFGNIPAQVDFLQRLGGRDGPAFAGPTIRIFRKAL